MSQGTGHIDIKEKISLKEKYFQAYFYEEKKLINIKTILHIATISKLWYNIYDIHFVKLQHN